MICLALAAGEEPVALLVDDLLGLQDGELDRVVQALVLLGTHETMFPHARVGVLLDHARGLDLTALAERRRPDAVALVLDRIDGRLGRPRSLPRSSAAETAQQALERKHA